MSRVRVVFLGTPESAVPSLEAAVEHFDVIAVLTRPEAPRGRGRALAPTPVSETAEAHGIDVHTVGDRLAVSEALASLGPVDLALLVAFGVIIGPEALAIPTRGFLNLHFSLLPRWRGAAPVTRAIMAGDDRVGATVMHLDEGLDTGPILSTWSFAVSDDDTSETITNRLAVGGADLLVSTAEQWWQGSAAINQPNRGVTFAAKITASETGIDWSRQAQVIQRHVRAFSPRPGARTVIAGVDEDRAILKILAASVIEMVEVAEVGEGRDMGGAPIVRCGDGWLRMDVVQPAGKRSMTGPEWLRGRRASGFKLE